MIGDQLFRNILDWQLQPGPGRYTLLYHCRHRANLGNQQSVLGRPPRNNTSRRYLVKIFVIVRKIFEDS